MATITVAEMKELAQLAKDDMMIHFMFRLEGLGVETVGDEDARLTRIDPKVFG